MNKYCPLPPCERMNSKLDDIVQSFENVLVVEIMDFISTFASMQIKGVITSHSSFLSMYQ